MAVMTGILTYEPYSYVCDSCNYESKPSALLSVIVRRMNKHRKDNHPERVASRKMPPKAPWRN